MSNVKNNNDVKTRKRRIRIKTVRTVAIVIAKLMLTNNNYFNKINRKLVLMILFRIDRKFLSYHIFFQEPHYVVLTVLIDFFSASVLLSLVRFPNFFRVVSAPINN